MLLGAGLNFTGNYLDASTARQSLTKTVTRQIVMVEKLTLVLAKQVESFYADEIDKKHVESENLDSKILLYSKRNPHSFSVRDLSNQKEQLGQKIKPHQTQNRRLLASVIDILIEKRNTRRHFEIILGTLLLNYPVDKKDANYAKRSEISKILRPIYQSALMSLLVEKILVGGFVFKSEFLSHLLLPFKGDDKDAQAQALITLQKVLVEIIYLKEMGFFSPQSLDILSRTGENNLLDRQNREDLCRQSKLSAQEFHHYGVGALEVSPVKITPSIIKAQDIRKLSALQLKELEDDRKQKLETEVLKAERKELMYQAARFSFVKEVLAASSANPCEIGALLKVCQVYTSFMLPVKGNVDKELNIKAYETMQKQVKAQKIDSFFTEKLLAMMGRFPIGSGIFLIDLRRHVNEFGTVDKAIVTSLNPVHPDEPEVKRVTTKYKYKLDSGTVVVPKRINLYFEEGRSAKYFTEKLKNRFKIQFQTEKDDVFFSFRANDAFRTLSISELKLW